MYKLFMIAKNNMKKQKGDMITLFILTFLSAFLIFTSISVLSGMNKVMDDAFEKINGAAVMLITGDNEEESAAAQKSFESEKPLDFEQVDVLLSMPDYKNASADEWSTNTFMFTSCEKEQRIQKVELPKDMSGNDIVVPYQMHDRLKKGDTLQIRMKDKVEEFRVVGYAEDPYFSVIMNINVYSCYITGEMYETLRTDYSDSVAEKIASLGTWDMESFDKDYTTVDLEARVTGVYKQEISPFIKEHPDFMSYMALNWETFRGGAQITPMVVMAILLFFSILILLITSVIISFSIKNFIQRNMKNTGILEASGYTVSQIRGAMLCQIGSVTGISTVLGLLLGVLGGGLMGSIVSSMLGLTWNRPVSIPLLILTGLFNIGLVLLVTLITGRRYKKITVLDSLRGGITNNNFRKNSFSFEKTGLPVSGVLSLKDTFGNPGRSLVLVLIIFLLGVCTAMGFGMWETFGSSKEKMIDIFAVEMADLAIQVEAEVGDELREIDGVKNVVAMVDFEPTARAGEKEASVYTYAYDDNANRQYVSVIEGRLPVYDNEVMITPGVADDLNVDVGDVLTLTYGSRSADYIIVGMDQKMERMGRLISMSYEGGEKLVPGRNTITYYVDGGEGEDFESMKAKVEELRMKSYPDKNWVYADVEKLAMESAVLIMDAMKAVCLILLVVTVLVVIFVESLVIRNRVTKEWKNLGVSRALGMTNRELISQIMFSNLPAVLLGSVIAVCLANIIGRNAIKLMLSIFGFKKIAFSVSPIWLVVTVLIIVLVASASAAFSGRKVKKLEPARLLTEE